MNLTSLSDLDLVASFQDTLVSEAENLVLQLDHIQELDRRKLTLEHSSLWSYLVHEKGMEEWQAERKIRVARWVRKYPELRDGLLSGRLNLSLIEIAIGVGNRERLSEEEMKEIFQAVSGKSCKAARRALATRYPKDQALPNDRIRPISETHSVVQFIASEELLTQIQEVKGLLGHSHPNASLNDVFEILAKEFLKKHKLEEKAQKSPAATRVIRENRLATQGQVHQLVRRDGYECSGVDPHTGIRCSSRHALEVDHDLAGLGHGRQDRSQ